MSLSAHFNVNCIDNMLRHPRTSFDWIRFDSNNDCNLKCVYCHNSRSTELLNLDTLGQFLNTNVIAIENFQFGCRMEPTLDSRLVDFMQLVAQSAVRPSRTVALQTNGILLHRHDQEKMVDAGLTDIQLSIDTIDEAVFASLRGGAKIGKVLRNVSQFSKKYSQVKIKFVVTVSTLNASLIEDLIKFGIDIGVKHFIVREMFHSPGVLHIDDKKMESLVLADGAFNTLSARLTEQFGDHVFLNLINKNGVLGYSNKVRKYSYNKSDII